MLLCLLGLGACPGPERSPSGDAPPVAAGPTARPAEAKATAPDLPSTPVFTWYDAHGRPRLAASIEEVPEEARGQVVVSQLGGGARAALAETVTIADYRAGAPTYSTIDLTALAQDTLDGDALLKHRSIYVYSAEWCGFCKKVKAFLREKQVPFTERDIEKNPQAAAELAAKAKAAGIKARGIPVTDIHGQLIVGFKREAIEKRLAEVGVPLHERPSPDKPARAPR